MDEDKTRSLVKTVQAMETSARRLVRLVIEGSLDSGKGSPSREDVEATIATIMAQYRNRLLDDVKPYSGYWNAVHAVVSQMITVLFNELNTAIIIERGYRPS